MIPPPPRCDSVRARESGTIIIILLILIALFAVVTLGASHTLTRLRTEVRALEQRHAARTASPADTSPGNPPTPRAAATATVVPDPTKPDEPAR